jgi:hypothetical protein
MLEENAKTAARSSLQGSPDSQAGTLRVGNLGGGQVPVAMRFVGRMPRAKCALLFGFSPAHGTTHGQYVLQCRFLGCHSNIIQHRLLEKWSILLLGIQWTRNGNVIEALCLPRCSIRSGMSVTLQLAYAQMFGCADFRGHHDCQAWLAPTSANAMRLRADLSVSPLGCDGCHSRYRNRGY